jgi:hypothetical protein
MSRRLAWALVPVVLVGSVVAQLRSADNSKPDPAAVERARKQVRMLDDLYKTAVVLITEHYVQDEQAVAAGTAARLLFKSMKDKGWHEARLIDATGEPYEEKNIPADEFEKSAITQLKAGQTFVDTVIVKDGKPYLRAATPGSGRLGQVHPLPRSLQERGEGPAHRGDWIHRAHRVNPSIPGQ